MTEWQWWQQITVNKWGTHRDREGGSVSLWGSPETVAHWVVLIMETESVTVIEKERQRDRQWQRQSEWHWWHTDRRWRRHRDKVWQRQMQTFQRSGVSRFFFSLPDRNQQQELLAKEQNSSTSDDKWYSVHLRWRKSPKIVIQKQDFHCFDFLFPL